jgi:hypothetical protein
MENLQLLYLGGNAIPSIPSSFQNVRIGRKDRDRPREQENKTTKQENKRTREQENMRTREQENKRTREIERRTC